MEFYTENQKDDGSDSDYSLDYEYLGPRQPNYRDDQDADSDASDLSCHSNHDCFDMWDEDPYSTNDFTWQSNDMKLTGFIKKRKKQLNMINKFAPWKSSSFWIKEKGWPKQLPNSMSTTNHDQSANSLSLVLSDYGTIEKLHTIYKDRILECGPQNTYPTTSPEKPSMPNDTTWLDHDKNDQDVDTTPSSTKYFQTHASLNPQSSPVSSTHYPVHTHVHSNDLISKFTSYTKYIKRSHFPIVSPYLTLTFEPMCLAEKYGYIAIGGIEGEFELYCNTNTKPTKIWGTKFKGKNNVLLLTNSIQIVRFKHLDEFQYYLITCMNDAGILVYELPSHNTCPNPPILRYHIRTFDRVPINDARISPDGQHLVCVGDAPCIFHIPVTFKNDHLHPGLPIKHTISTDSVFSSQYLAWSKSSLYFAHTSDSHNTVFVWQAQPLKLIHRIDAAGYTYAVQFHPEIEGVLVFSNRYGYIHTINLEERYYDHVRHEITMISFRGEKNTKLRILAKINGLQWSHDGRYLYVSTKKRVLAYQFTLQTLKSLETLATNKVLSLLDLEKKRRRKRWAEKWKRIPTHLQQSHTHQLASHYK